MRSVGSALIVIVALCVVGVAANADTVDSSTGSSTAAKVAQAAGQVDTAATAGATEAGADAPAADAADPSDGQVVATESGQRKKETIHVGVAYFAFMPTDGDTKRNFGELWNGFGVGVFRPEAPSKLGFSWSLSVLSKNGESDALLVPMTVGVQRGFRAASWAVLRQGGRQPGGPGREQDRWLRECSTRPDHQPAVPPRSALRLVHQTRGQQLQWPYPDSRSQGGSVLPLSGRGVDALSRRWGGASQSRGWTIVTAAALTGVWERPARTAYAGPRAPSRVASEARLRRTTSTGGAKRRLLYAIVTPLLTRATPRWARARSCPSRLLSRAGRAPVLPRQEEIAAR
jgi:hypothetical protein